MGPPWVNVPEATKQSSPRLLHDYAVMDMRAAVNITPANERWALTYEDAPAESEIAKGPRRLDDTEAGAISDEGTVGRMRDALLSGLPQVLSGGWKFDCAKPMCDIFYPEMIDYVSLVKLSKLWWSSNSAHNIPVAGSSVIVGYCKCDGPIYDKVRAGQASNEARSIVLTLVVQTIFPAVFKSVFLLTSGTYTGCCKCCMKWFNYMATALLIGLCTTMVVCLAMVQFDPQGWRNAAAISAVNLATLDPLQSFVKLAVCIRAGWPLRAVGFSPPNDALTDRPAYICCNMAGSRKARSLMQAGRDPDEQDPEPARLGRSSPEE